MFIRLVGEARRSIRMAWMMMNASRGGDAAIYRLYRSFRRRPVMERQAYRSQGRKECQPNGGSIACQVQDTHHPFYPQS